MKRTVTADVERISQGSGRDALYRIIVDHDSGTRELASANNLVSGDLQDLLLSGVAPQLSQYVTPGIKRITLTIESDDSWGEL